MNGNNRCQRACTKSAFALLLLILGAGNLHAQIKPLDAAALVNETDVLPYESITPSPDGKWIVFEASDSTKAMQFDYVGQIITKSGYPMLAGAQAISVYVINLTTHKTTQLSSPQGSSWNPSWSPDSRYLAFLSDRGGRAALWVWDRQTAQVRQVSDAATFSSWWRQRPLWSADGKTVLLNLVPEGMTLEDVLNLSPLYRNRNASASQLPPLNAAAPTVHVYSFHPEDKKPEPAKAAAAAPKQSSVGDDEGNEELEASDLLDGRYRGDLGQIDIATGKVTYLVKHIHPSAWDYSPDQSAVVFMNFLGTVPSTQQIAFSIDVYNFQDGKVRSFGRGYLDANNLPTRISWSTDGAHLLYSDTGKTKKRACYVIDIKTGEKQEISSEIPPTSIDFSWGPPIFDKTGKNVYLLDATAGRLWEVSIDGKHTREVVKLPGTIKDVAVNEAARTYWSPDDGKTMIVRTHDSESKKDALYAVTAATGESKKLYENYEAIQMSIIGGLVGSSLGGGSVVYSSESASRPSDIFLLDLAKPTPVNLTNMNPQYDAASMGKIRIIDWRSLQGEALHGTLLLPAGYREGTRYPLVVWVYGGMMGSDYSNRFGFGWGSMFNPQMWASRGYAVLFPDVPLHPGTPVDDLVSAVIPGVNKAVELGIVDPERLAVMGQSFGGYNTISLITRTSIFKAAVATSSANTDLMDAYTDFESGIAPWMGYYEEGQGGMHGTPWEFKERYYMNSPIYFLDRVTTPLLLERGMTDLISRNNGNVFIALRRLNKDVELLEYEHENHVLQMHVNVIDFWNRRIDWVNKYLQPAESPKPQ